MYILVLLLNYFLNKNIDLLVSIKINKFKKRD